MPLAYDVSGGAWRAVGSWVGLTALLLSAALATNVLHVRERLIGSIGAEPRAAAVARDLSEGSVSAPNTVLRSQPWWQRVRELRGDAGRSTKDVVIDPTAIQWRATLTCSTGRLTVTGVASSPAVLACPVQAERVYSTRKGAQPLVIAADGPWRALVEQQVDVPLVEPPLTAVRDGKAVRVAGGRLHRVDQVGKGEVTIYQLPDRRFALRLQDFYITPNSDLLVQLSRGRAPRTTSAYDVRTAVTVASLDVTAGSLNLVLPEGVDPAAYRSLGIYCERTHNVYAAAELRPTP